MINQGIEKVVIESNHSNQRLDIVLTCLYPDFSRSYFQFLIENGDVRINGKPVKKREKVKSKDLLEICFSPISELSLLAQDIELDIIYEDEYLIAINKPAGMVVHPAPGHSENTLVNALLHHCEEIQLLSDDLRPGIVHRLDKDTSGIMIAAKTERAQQSLIDSFASREINKTYLLVCIGVPSEQIINKPIKRHAFKRQEMAISDLGRPAITKIKTIKSNGTLSLVEAKPVTGRTHQIRVHMKSIGYPILGDEVYGNKKWNNRYKLDKQLLHSYKVSFRHPVTNKNLVLSTSVPKWYNLVD